MATLDTCTVPDHQCNLLLCEKRCGWVYFKYGARARSLRVPFTLRIFEMMYKPTIGGTIITANTAGQ